MSKKAQNSIAESMFYPVIGMTADFSSEIVKSRGDEKDFFEVLK